MFRFWLSAALFLAVSVPTFAQPIVVDDFGDGNFSADPAWTGDASHFTVIPFGEGFALRSDGPARADTLALATASGVTTGRWAFTFRHEANLSNSNGARVYLMADTPLLKGDVRGYYLQFGTNNLNRVELWRQDGAPSQRTRLGASGEVVAGDANTVRLEAARDEDGRWTVWADGEEVIGGVTDLTHRGSMALGFWVKHSAANGGRFFLTGVYAQAVDTRPPTLLRAEALSSNEIRAWFSEPVAACPPSAFVLQPSNLTPEAAACDPSGRVDLRFGQPLAGPASYTLIARGVADLAGNVQHETATSFFLGTFDVPQPGEIVVNEIMYAPDDISSNEYVEILNRTVDRTFDISVLRLANAASPPRAVIGETMPLAPGAFAVLVRDPEAFAARFPGVPFLVVDRFPALLNGGDTVQLLRTDGTVLDAVPYRSTWGGQGAALERRNAEGYSYSAGNWASSPASTGGTPGASNAVAPDTRAPTLLSASPSPDGREIVLLFDEPLAPSTVTPSAFSLSGGGGTPEVVILEGEGVGVRLAWASPPSPGLYTLTVGGVADGVGNTLREASIPVLLGTLDAPGPGEIAITEVMYRAAEEASEYVEIQNLTGRPFDLRALTLSVGTTERPVSEVPAVLPPRGTLALARDAEALRAWFGPGGGLHPMPRLAALPNTGTSVVLRHGEVTLDSVAYRSAWHRPELRDDRGVALERLDPNLPTHAPGAWTSSLDPRGGTPGRPNSVALPPGEAPSRPGLTVSPSPFDAQTGTVVRYTLAADAGLVRIRVFDGGGRVVRTLEEGTMGGSTRAGEAIWDGRDDRGQPLRVGIYVVLLEGVDLAGGRTESYRTPVVLARSL